MRNFFFLTQSNLWLILKDQYRLSRLTSTLLILFFLFFKSEEASAQYAGHERFNVYSPNTYSLGQYGDIPVNLSSGIPQISIPIVQFTDKDINLDVSLSYHASGIKVDEEASWVGLGWALNAGGMITREVRGVPDGYTYSGLQSRTSIPDFAGSSYDDVSIKNYMDQVKYKLRDGALNISDNASDIFYYNFNGRSGRFFLDGTANATLAQYEDFKIEFVPDANNNAGNPLYIGGDFIITDERGFVYEFKDHETVNYSNTSGKSYTSSWYLSKIKSPSGGQLTFEYAPGGTIASLYQKRRYSEAYFALGQNNPEHYLPVEYASTYFDYDEVISGIVLKKITSSSGNYLEFVTSPDTRKDSELLSNNQLDFIVLKDRNNRQVKKFRFDYSYFEANKSRQIPVEQYSNKHCLNYRLRLDSFREIAVDGRLQSPYRFEYYGDNDPNTDDPYTLPPRLSPCQDHWGYYNNSNNKTIFPSNPQNLPFRIDDWAMQLTPSGEGYGGTGPSFAYSVPNGGTREPNIEASKACALNKIIFPTGGYSRFVFGAHLANENDLLPICGGLRIKQIETKESSGSAAIIKNYEYPGLVVSEKCIGSENPYYTWFSSGYNPQFPSEQGNWQKLAAFGVPATLSTNNRFIARVEGASQLGLGARTNVIYTSVKEISPGNGFTVYNFKFAYDVEFPGDLNSDGLSVPGLFNSALVQTESIGTYKPTFLYKTISPCTFPYPNFINNDWRRGHLESKETRSENGTLLSKNYTEYDIRALKAVPGYKVTSFGDEIQYFYSRYYDIGGMAKPISEVTELYNNDGSYIRTEKKLFYSSANHKQLTESREYGSKLDSIATKYFYPTEYGSLLSGLKDKHILAPVDIRKYRNAKLISGEQVQYGANGLPLTIYSAESIGTDIAFNPQSPYTFSPKLSNVYDAKNNLSSQTVADGVTYVYLWGYNGQYPIAKIANSDYTTVNSVITQTQIDNAITSGEADLRALLNTLRASTLLKGAQITTYIYSPLVGMTSMTDPKGMVTYYEYDSFNRLQFVKDKDSNVLQRFCYNYQGQLTDCGAGLSSGTVYKNVSKSQSFTRQGCAAGEVGSVLAYTVPAGIYSSTVSQADADAKADAEITANGQNFANANGSCLTIPTAPAGLAFASATATSVNFTWNAVSSATEYRIYRGGSYISTVSAPSTSGSLTGLATGTSYNVQIMAVNGTVQGPLSGAVAMSTLPAAPSAPVQGATTSTTLAFSWPAVTGALSYNIYKDNILAGSVTAPALSASLSSLAGSSSYQISISAVNSSGEGARSASVQMSTRLVPPSGLTFQSAGSNSITFAWAAVSGATKYKIYNGGNYAGEVLAPSVSMTLAQLNPSSLYGVQVLASNGAGDGDLSAVVNMGTSPGLASAPSINAGATTASSLSFTWPAVAGATGYRIVKETAVDNSVAATSGSLSGLAAGTSYNVKIRAYNSWGEGTESAPTSMITKPAAPTGLAFQSAGPGSINFSWTAVAGATGYKIYKNDVEYGSVSSAYGSLSALDINTSYNIKVSAYNTSGEGAYTPNTAMSTVLPAPIGVAFTASNESTISLSWNAVAGATGYKILRDGLVAGSSSTNSGTLFSLAVGTTYNVQVLATNVWGDGVLSTGVPMSTALAAPTGLAFTSSNSSTVNFSWNAVAGASGYKIYRDGTYIGAVGTTSGSVSGLSPSTTYYIQVRAYNASDGALSSSVAMTTTAAPAGYYKISGPYPATQSFSGNILNNLGSSIYVYGVIQSAGTSSGSGYGGATVLGVSLGGSATFTQYGQSFVSTNYVLLSSSATPVPVSGYYSGTSGSYLVLAYSLYPGGPLTYWSTSN